MQFNKPHPPLRKVEGVALHSNVLKQVMVVLYPGELNLKKPQRQLTARKRSLNSKAEGHCCSTYEQEIDRSCHMTDYLLLITMQIKYWYLQPIIKYR